MAAATLVRVAEVMTPALVTVNSADGIAACALRMEHLGLRHLPVVDSGRLVGIVTDAALHGAAVHPSAGIADVVAHVDVVARPGDDLASIIRSLARSRQDCAVVVDDREHPVGFLTEHDLLKVALVTISELLTVECLPRRPLVTVDGDAPGSVALDLMIRHHIRHLPVSSRPDGVLVGVVSLRDLVAADVRRRTVLVEELRSKRVFTASPRTLLVNCAARMFEHRVGCLPIVQHGLATGIVTRRDLVVAAAAALEAESR
jgi:CBS domain-containing protein